MADKTLSVSLSAVKAGLNESLENLESTLEDINDQLALMSFSAASASASLKSLNAETSKLNQRLGGASREGSSLAQTANALTNMSDEFTDGIRKLGKELNKTTGNMEKTSDSSKKTSGAIGVLNTVFQGTTVNIGAFNLQLKNLIVTLPIVTGLIGSVTVAMGSLFTVIAGIAGLLGAGLAAGFAQDLQDIEENSAEVTDTFEAMEEKMSRIRDAIVEATEPLQIQAFQTLADQVGGGLLWALNQFSIQMAESVDLIFALKDAIADPFVANFNKTLDALTNSVSRLLPVIQSISEYLAKSLPKFIRFSTAQTMRFSKEIGNLIKSFIKFGKQATKLTITIIKGLAPVITLALDALSSILNVINKIPSSIVSLVVKITVLWIIFEKLLDRLTSAEGLLGQIAEFMDMLQGEGSALTSVFENQIDTLSSYNEKLRETAEVMKNVGDASDTMPSQLRKQTTKRHLEGESGGVSPKEGESGVISSVAVSLGLDVLTSKLLGTSSTIGKLKVILGSVTSAFGFLTSALGTLTGVVGTLGSIISSALLSPLAPIIAMFLFLADVFDLLTVTIGAVTGFVKALINIFDVVIKSIEVVGLALIILIVKPLQFLHNVANATGKVLNKMTFGVFPWLIKFLGKGVKYIGMFADWLGKVANKLKNMIGSIPLLGGGGESGGESNTKEKAKSTKSAKSDTSAESMRKGDTIVNNTYNQQANINQNVQDPEMTAKEKRLLNEAMQQFTQDINTKGSGS
jgi:methyl-accepting chemotaxis protein